MTIHTGVGLGVRTQKDLIVEIARKVLPLIPGNSVRSQLRSSLVDSVIIYLLHLDLKLPVEEAARIVGRSRKEAEELFQRAKLIESNDSEVYEKILDIRDRVLDVLALDGHSEMSMTQKVKKTRKSSAVEALPEEIDLSGILERVAEVTEVAPRDVENGGQLRPYTDTRAITMAIAHGRNPEGGIQYMAKFFSMQRASVLYALRRVSELVPLAQQEEATDMLAERMRLVCTKLGVPLELLIFVDRYQRKKKDES